MVTQLNPPLPMSCPKGEGFAHFLIDYGPESDLYWTIFITETGEVWTYANKHVRASKNITLGRTLAKSAEPTSALDVVLSNELETDAMLRARLMACEAMSFELSRETVLASGHALDAIAARLRMKREPIKRYQPPQL